MAHAKRLIRAVTVGFVSPPVVDGCVWQVVGNRDPVIGWHILDGREEVVAPREQWTILSFRPGDARSLASGDRPFAQSPVLEATLAKVLLIVVFRHASDDDWELPFHEGFDLITFLF